MGSLEVTRETLRIDPDGSATYDWTFRHGVHGAAFRVELRRSEADGKYWTVIQIPDHVLDASDLTRTPHGYKRFEARAAYASREQALSEAESEIRELLQRSPNFR